MKTGSRLLLLTLLFCFANAQAGQYALTPLQPGSAGESHAYAINNAGAVLGWATDTRDRIDNGFVWQSGATRWLPLAEESYRSTGRAINEAGAVAGTEAFPDGQHRATVWSANGGPNRYFPQELQYTNGIDINAGGWVITGGYGGYDRKSMLWNPDGSQVRELPAFRARFDNEDPADPFDPVAEAWALNDLHQVVGSSEAGDHSLHAVMWRDGQIVDLHGGIGQDSVARDINNAGQVVVNTRLGDSAQRVGIWQNGSLHYLSTPVTLSEGLAINEKGTVAGWTALDSGEHHAALWEGGAAFDLNSLIAGARGEFAYLETAYGINDQGQIVGEGRTGNGSYRAFLLTPVPEPAQWAMLMLGIGLVLLHRNRRQP